MYHVLVESYFAASGTDIDELPLLALVTLSVSRLTQSQVVRICVVMILEAQRIIRGSQLDMEVGRAGDGDNATNIFARTDVWASLEEAERVRGNVPVCDLEAVDAVGGDAPRASIIGARCTEGGPRFDSTRSVVCIRVNSRVGPGNTVDDIINTGRDGICADSTLPRAAAAAAAASSLFFLIVIDNLEVPALIDVVVTLPKDGDIISC